MVRGQEYCGKVLVAEDNPANQKLMEVLLKKEGITPVMAADGHQAVETAVEQSFDLIFMDIQMPNMNGYEATRKLRKKGQTTPIVALTASAMKEDEEKCLQAGCDDYLAKPLVREQLIEVLDKYLISSSGAVWANSEAIKNSPADTEPTSAVSGLGIIDWETLVGIGDDEEVIGKIAGAFCKDGLRCMEKIVSAIEEEDWAMLELYAHRMKGGSATIGAKGVSEKAGLLEQAGLKGDLETARLLIGQLQSEVDGLLPKHAISLLVSAWKLEIAPAPSFLRANSGGKPIV